MVKSGERLVIQSPKGMYWRIYGAKYVQTGQGPANFLVGLPVDQENAPIDYRLSAFDGNFAPWPQDIPESVPRLPPTLNELLDLAFVFYNAKQPLALTGTIIYMLLSFSPYSMLPGPEALAQIKALVGHEAAGREALGRIHWNRFQELVASQSDLTSDEFRTLLQWSLRIMAQLRLTGEGS
ncbi:MAG TPA: hypothetical protein VLA88_04200 [Candidatus Saccharimonadales bacterium]|nr:hypothetical protein [Candidatus Saccharimonadales bacterium]